jgi:hypothetical protein
MEVDYSEVTQGMNVTVGKLLRRDIIKPTNCTMHDVHPYLHAGPDLHCMASIRTRFTTSYNRQNFQNDRQLLSACLVVLHTVFKNHTPTQDPRSRFF